MSIIKGPAGHLVKGIILAITLMVCAQDVQGLRGCSSFGHSCFGAHGKRTDGRDDLAPSEKPEISDSIYPLNPRYDVNVPDSRDYGAMNINLPSASGKRLPVALLKLLRNLATDMDEQSSSNKK